MDISSFSSISWSSTLNTKTQNRQNLPGNVLPATTLTAAPIAKDDPVKEFQDYMKESPAQRMVDSWLEQHGITRQQFDAMNEADKQKLLAQMKEELKHKIKENVEKSVTTNMLV